MERVLRNEEISEIMPFDYNAPVLFFPIRHHSPVCSYHLIKAIEEYEPDCILIEGPENANPLIDVITDRGTVPPIALYGSFKDVRGRVSDDCGEYKCYYPLLDSSPEYNALIEAERRSVHAEFIDFSYGEFLIQTKDSSPAEITNETVSRYDDHYLVQNEYFNTLCQKTGMRNYEEFWECFFEIDGLTVSTEEFVRRLSLDCHIIRKNTSEEEMRSDGTFEREKFMAEKIRNSAAKYKRILVVTGGFHSEELYRLTNNALGFVGVKSVKISQQDNEIYPMSYSFESADALNGYASGLLNPGFYDKVWKRLKEEKNSVSDELKAYENTVTELVSRCLHECVRSKILITLSDAGAAVSAARGLAMLRNKKSAGLYELYDGVQSCFIKGDISGNGSLPIQILKKLAAGDQIGKLSDKAVKPPIVQDFEMLAKKYRLKIRSVSQNKCELDIFTKKTHMEMSRFFYQMDYLGTQFAKRLKGPDLLSNADRSRIREIWTYKRGETTESALIDASVYGGTIEQACTVLAGRRIKDAAGSADGAELYVRCFLMGIDVNERFAGKMTELIVNDGDFFSVGRAVRYFSMLKNLSGMYSKDMQLAQDFLMMCFNKSVIMLPSMTKVGEEYSFECIKICKQLYDLTVNDFTHDEYVLLIDVFRKMTEKDNVNPSVCGAVMGLLYAGDQNFRRKIAETFSGFMSGTPEVRKNGALFLRGLFCTARDIILVGDEFIGLIDKLLRTLSMEEFMEVLPELRMGFSYFTPRETDKISQKAAELYGVGSEKITNKTDFYEDLYYFGNKLDGEIFSEVIKI